MSARIEYRCTRHPGGYRIIAFDQRKVGDWSVDENYDVKPPSDATDDEKRVLEQFGFTLMPHPEEPPSIIYFLEPISPEIETYDLFESAPGLFIEFANTPTTVEGVKSFADRNGVRFAGKSSFYGIESFYFDIPEMRSAVNAWNKAKETGDFKRLVRIVAKRAERRVFSSESDAGAEANVLLALDATRGDARLSIRPPNLTEAMWIQFILAVDGNFNIQPCSECPKWIPIASAGHRSDRRYCSDACRMRAYRKRKPKKKGG